MAKQTTSSTKPASSAKAGKGAKAPAPTQPGCKAPALAKPQPRGKAQQTAHPLPAIGSTKAPVQMYMDFVQPKGAARCGNKVGLQSGLLLTHYLNELFYHNYAWGANDASLQAAIVAEFPNRASVQTVGAYRSYFNKGLHGFGTGQPLVGDERLPQFKGNAKPQC